MSDDYNYGVCGVFCEMCPTGNGLILEHASKLSSIIEKSDYSWAEVDFDFADVERGLRWLVKMQCPGCKNIEEPWCDVLKCEKVTSWNMESCLLCDELATCERTEYHRGRYPYVLEHQQRVREIGLAEHWKEQRKRALDGVTLIDIRAY